MVFKEGRHLTDFLGRKYSTSGVAKASLLSLLPIYPKTSVENLSKLQRQTSTRSEQAGDTSPPDNEPALMVVLFKKFQKNIPSGITSDTLADFFTSLFTYSTPESRLAYHKSTSSLLVSAHYYVLAITAPMFANNGDELLHHIIASTLYMYDNKHGSYVVLLGVTDRGYPDACTLSEQYFNDPSDLGILTDTSSFRGHGLCSFLLSMIQVLGSLGYKAPVVPEPAAPFPLQCDEQFDKHTHHLYLQACLEIGSAYVMYVKLGFTSPVAPGNDYHCSSYKDECPVNANRKYSWGAQSYHTDYANL